jgi:hypothetical protein
MPGEPSLNKRRELVGQVGAPPEGSGAGRMAKPPYRESLYMIVFIIYYKALVYQGDYDFFLPWVFGKCIIQPSGSPKGLLCFGVAGFLF